MTIPEIKDLLMQEPVGHAQECSGLSPRKRTEYWQSLRVRWIEWLEKIPEPYRSRIRELGDGLKEAHKLRRSQVDVMQKALKKVTKKKVPTRGTTVGKKPIKKVKRGK